MAPDMTVKAAATDRVMTRRILLAVTVRERTAQPSHRGYRPASHMASRNHYDRNSAASQHDRRAPSSSVSPAAPPLNWCFTPM
jgi:ribosome assembly protein YihI (activator of Der GTPase)